MNSRQRSSSLQSSFSRNKHSQQSNQQRPIRLLFPATTEEERELQEQHYIPSRYIVAIGDVHGHLQALQKLLKKLEQHLGKDLFEKYHLVFLGDYVDRGPQIKETIEFMISLKKQRKPNTTHFLMGNHDHACSMFLGLFDDALENGKSLGITCQNYTREFELWKGIQEVANNMHLQGRRWGSGFVYSSFNTFYSYICDSNSQKDMDVVGDFKKFQSKVPDEHKNFFRNLPWVLFNEDNIFVHGGFHSYTNLKEQLVPLFKRDIYQPRVKPLSERGYIDMDGHKDTHRRIVSGHVQVKNAKVSSKRALIDISGGVTGELCALILPSAKVITTEENSVLVKGDMDDEELQELLKSD
ncbi:hypothetical protein C9374_007128 [Naegleria lovaniensis]|uniref:Calcineurin-like phosphoesterase domain-containing protein n=1 Tax=Naegleria lovaniensis TaxID=51637 RepID=A0AA88GEG6_NAELO|nr:uncharacterized protein C9374_013808 [Naegleria lovaniensis]XP_044555491.1 uncharacterized protein C9374_007128 [Naegleria lovaniensis]KAG2370852.1 hypothetical protein C9374_013808 [Naegleria lovaniensis]KAG2393597.1 hypothetical protein C9374_007128 [Naegleria lovaniensis]